MLKRWRFVLLGCVWFVTPGAFADWELNMPRGVTEISREVYGLHMLIFWICVAIAVVVFGAMIYSIITHRKSGNRQPATFSHSTKVEIVWTVIPLAILIAMAIPAAEGLIKIEDTRAVDLNIKVTGYQWRWRYDYIDEEFGFDSNLSKASYEARQLGSGIDPFSVDHYLRDVDNPLIVPIGAKVRVLVTSGDVIHSWWVPELGGKKDAIPGFVNEWWFRISEPGIYRGQCAELCGKDHAFMPVVVKAVEPAEYAAWADEQRGLALVTFDYDKRYELAELMEIGEGVYNTVCAACHQVNGQGLPPTFPALVGSPSVMGELDGHVDVVLNGRKGTAMQAFGGQLEDLDIAAVLTYERNAWGQGTGDVVQPAQIRDAR